MNIHRVLTAALLTFACTAAARAQTAPATMPDPGDASAPWRNPALSPDARARDLLPRLTLDEKISLLHADGTFTSPGLPRFHIPKLWMSDGPQGVREEIQPSTWNSANHSDDFSTAMPADIGLAASFDPDLAKAYGNVIGEEARARHKNIMLCPGLNIMRTPLNGRNSEYFGEDPFLASRMAVKFIEGIQQNGVAACIKHFALNNQENNRSSVNVHIDERTLHEIYLPAFKAAVTEGHAWCVMTAYNRVNGQFCSENRELLTDILKHDWQFPGLVMTDWGGAHSTIPCALNGLDLEMGSNVGGDHNNDFLAAKLLDAVNAGQVPMARIDDMALRNLRVMAATGNLDPAPQPLPATDTLMAPEHIAAARAIAESGIVLLKNADNLLPLDPAKIHSIAVIGQNATAKFAHDGNSAAIKTSYEVTPLEGITKRAGEAIKITYVEGYTRSTARGGRRGIGGAVTPTSTSAPATQSAQIAQAVAAAKAADVAIVVAGLYRAQDQEGADRPNMNLPPGQADLIAAVAKANPKTIVILNGGSPSVVEPWIDDSAALLMYWYGGTEGGNALARVLFGDVNPSGHLPCTWPRQLADTPASHPNDPAIFPGIGNNVRGSALTPDTGPQETYAEKLLVGYRWYDAQKIEPQFPFGFGLSYTTFAFSGLQVAALGGNVGAIPIQSGDAEVQCQVANTGKRDGAAVVQVYVEPVNPPVDRPLQELKAFQKVMLKPGESKKISLQLPPTAFAYYAPEKHAWIAEAGDYIIHVGDSSRSLPLHQTFHLAKSITLPESLSP